MSERLDAELARWQADDEPRVRRGRPPGAASPSSETPAHDPPDGGRRQPHDPDCFGVGVRRRRRRDPGDAGHSRRQRPGRPATRGGAEHRRACAGHSRQRHPGGGDWHSACVHRRTGDHAARWCARSQPHVSRAAQRLHSAGQPGQPLLDAARFRGTDVELRAAGHRASAARGRTRGRDSLRRGDRRHRRHRRRQQQRLGDADARAPRGAMDLQGPRLLFPSWRRPCLAGPGGQSSRRDLHRAADGRSDDPGGLANPGRADQHGHGHQSDLPAAASRVHVSQRLRR